MINTNTFPHIFWIQKVINISSGVVYPPIHHKVFMINNNTFPPIFLSCRLHVGQTYTTPYECIASMSKITSPNKLIITYKSISLPSKLKLKIINFFSCFLTKWPFHLLSLVHILRYLINKIYLMDNSFFCFDLRLINEIPHWNQESTLFNTKMRGLCNLWNKNPLGWSTVFLKNYMYTKLSQTFEL